VQSKKWVGGIIRGRVYHISLSISGREYRETTRCHTLPGALEQLARFERDPDGYVPGSDEKAATGIAGLIKDYLVHSEATNGEKHVDQQRAAYLRWGAYLSPLGVATVEAFTVAIADGFIAWRRAGNAALHEAPRKRPKRGPDGLPLPNALRPVGEAAVNRDLAAMMSLMSWAVRLEKIAEDANPMRKVHLLKEHRDIRPHRPATDEELDAVLPFLSAKWADAAIVLRGSGFRWGSFARLNLASIDKARGILRDPDGKTLRAIEVTHVPKEAIDAAIRCCGRRYPDDEAQQLGRALTRACRKAGVRRFTSYDLRHGAATRWHEQGIPLRQIQAWLGHADLKTTEGYIGLRGRG
jgi:integrase